MYCDIVFEGKSFSPKKLSRLASLPLESLAEAGEMGVRGRHRGKPMPYGMALLKVDPENLDSVIDELRAKKELIRESGVEEIRVENLLDDYSEINIDKDTVKKISALDAGIDFLLFNEEKQGTISIVQVKQAADTFGALNHPLRYKLVQIINKEGEITSFELWKRTREMRSKISTHLRKLVVAKVVASKKTGKSVYYTVNRQRLFEINKFANNISQVHFYKDKVLITAHHGSGKKATIVGIKKAQKKKTEITVAKEPKVAYAKKK